LFLSTLGDFIIGNLIYEQSNNRKRKLLLYASLVLNLGVLSFFKYFNFFIESVSELLINIGMQPNLTSLEIILPVGISFYTFQTLSYTIDVYRKDLIPTKDIIAFSSFVSFFPQLVAGPIERAQNLLPQFFFTRVFDLQKAKSASRQILWGFFKKYI
jgi:D-alanyl-lipoteichoic acid acyltransferase DltB (MBOAT superfamily)